MELNLGYRASKAQSWRAKDVRELVLRLKEANPAAGESRLVKLFRDHIREDDDYADAAAFYCVRSALNAMENQRERQRQREPIVKAQREATEKIVEADIKAQIIILNLEMPNGKRMRYCTGAEMAKFGGAYARIAKKVGKTKRVGEVMSEAEVKKLMI